MQNCNWLMVQWALSSKEPWTAEVDSTVDRRLNKRKWKQRSLDRVYRRSSISNVQLPEFVPQSKKNFISEKWKRKCSSSSLQAQKFTDTRSRVSRLSRGVAREKKRKNENNFQVRSINNRQIFCLCVNWSCQPRRARAIVVAKRSAGAVRKELMPMWNKVSAWTA